MPLFKFVFSFIAGISISIQALADIKSPDDSLSSDQVIKRANTLQDTETILIDGIPIVNAPCQFHKEASVPFPDDYKFKNPIFHKQMGDHWEYSEYAFTLTPNGMRGKYPSEYNNCRLVEDKGDNVTYKCDKNYYRFEYVGWRKWEHRWDKAFFVYTYSSPDGTFNGITHEADSHEWALFSDMCPPPASRRGEATKQCLTLDDVRPTLPDPMPTCPIHPFTTTPLPKNTQFKNPIFAMEMEKDDKNSVYLTPTPTSIAYRIHDYDENKYADCSLIENNMTNITYYCKHLPSWKYTYEDEEEKNNNIDGFIRIRSVGFENHQGGRYFEYGKCRMFVSITKNTKNDLKEAFDRLNSYFPTNFTVETTSCGPTERHPIFRPFHPMVFPGDMCVPAK